MLQGDSLSPLLFKLCMHISFTTAKEQKAKRLGYVYDAPLTPRYWFQLTDDAAISPSVVEGDQLLLDVFSN